MKCNRPVLITENLWNYGLTDREVILASIVLVQFNHCHKTAKTPKDLCEMAGISIIESEVFFIKLKKLDLI